MLVDFPIGHISWGWARLKPGIGNPVLVFHMGDRCPGAQTTFSPFPGTLPGQLELTLTLWIGKPGLQIDLRYYIIMPVLEQVF